MLLYLTTALSAAIVALAINNDTEIRCKESARKLNESLFWGPYRPNLYFGVRPRGLPSFLGGFMWARVDDFASIQDRVRHTCEQSDGMQGYGWDEFDAQTGGLQNIYDEGNGLNISTAFVKIPGGVHGGSWATRIRGTVRKEFPRDLNSTVIFYASLGGVGSLSASHRNDPRGFENDVTLIGQSPGLGEFKVTISHGSGQHPRSEHEAYKSKPLDRTFVDSILAPEHELWQSKVMLYRELRVQIDEYLKKYGEQNPPPPPQMFTIPQRPGSGNIHLIQKTFQGSFEFDVVFESKSAEQQYDYAKISKLIEKMSKDYWQKFSKIFVLQAPFDAENFQRFASSLFSNLLGGLGYFNGDSVVDRSYAIEYDEENEGFWQDTAIARARKQEKLEGPSELFTMVPSRSFFPRGFLWDEGFHLIPIVDWDLELSLEILQSWFNLMDDDGWIGREQILGDEARSKVPTEFQVQYPHYANPPTLFFIVKILASKFEALNSRNDKNDLDKSELILQKLRDLYPKLWKHFNWYRKTQVGDIHSYDRNAFSTHEAYRWRGRSEQHVLTSGLDDYPRPQPPHPGELHVDLMSWMGMMTNSLHKIASVLGYHDDLEKLERIYIAISRNLDDLHWSEEDKCYCDATIDAYEEHILVCHKGYISIFPFLTGILEPTSDKLGHILNLLADKESLWSPFGIRSLSKSSEYYGTGENYWRGPVWINMNYLILSQLLRYAQVEGPHQQRSKEIYGQLRLNLVRTTYNSWVETGFVWEQYNADTGKGQRTQHFTGWTSLIIKIMGMPDLSSDGRTITEENHDEL